MFNLEDDEAVEVVALIDDSIGLMIDEGYHWYDSAEKAGEHIHFRLLRKLDPVKWQAAVSALEESFNAWKKA